ncbi:MAG: hypothetical protein MRZ79_02260 [Bacteroidia bacterium]|nr:hypothetical protein [Bacteroidia bacterium]
MASHIDSHTLFTQLGYQTKYLPDREKQLMIIQCFDQNQQAVLEIHLPENSEEAPFVRDLVEVDQRKFSRLGCEIQFFEPAYYQIAMGPDLIETLLDMHEIETNYKLMWMIAKLGFKNQKRNFFLIDAVFELFDSLLPDDEVEEILRHPFFFHRGQKIYFVDNTMDYLLFKELSRKEGEQVELRQFIRWEGLRFFKEQPGESIQIIQNKLKQTKEKAVRNQMYERAAQITKLERDFLLEIYRRHWPNFEEADGEDILRDLI